MAKKKVSETIEQQRKAREEFLKLKQMQSGDVKPQPKPSEEAIMPKTFGEKIANIWFHYKNYIIVGTLSVIFLTILVAQCATKVESDLEIVYCSYTSCFDDEVVKMEEYFEQYVEDLNGDGEVTVNIINCSYDPESVSYEYKNAMLQKIQAALAANPKALLYITDTQSIKYFEEMKVKSGLFDGEPISLGKEFSEEIGSSELDIALPEDLQISIRVVSGTTMEKEDGIEEVLAASKKLLESIKK